MAKRAAKKKVKRKAARKTTAARKKPKAPETRKRRVPISTPKKRKSAGRPPFEPTAEDRKRVEALAGYGFRQEEICLVIFNPTTGEPIGEKTLRRRFVAELRTGGLKANALVAESLFKRATASKADSRPGDAACAIWWTKIRMGWKERTVVEVETKSGVLVSPAAMTPAEWIAAAQARADLATEPGAEENDNGMNGGKKSKGDKVIR